VVRVGKGDNLKLIIEGKDAAAKPTVKPINNIPDSFEDINKFDEFLTSYEYADTTIKKNKDLKIELSDGKVTIKETDTTVRQVKTKQKISVYEENPEFQNINAILDKYRYSGQ
jgi:hypothetical protein